MSTTTAINSRKPVTKQELIAANVKLLSEQLRAGKRMWRDTAFEDAERAIRDAVDASRKRYAGLTDLQRADDYNGTEKAIYWRGMEAAIRVMRVPRSAAFHVYQAHQMAFAMVALAAQKLD